VRFADDFVILAKAEAHADAALERMRTLLRAQGLGLNPDKTRIVSFDQGFRFLGHLFVRSMVLKSVEPDGRADSAPDASSELLRWIARQDAETAAAAARVEADRAAGLEPGLRVLCLREPGRVLAVRNMAFTVEEETLNRRRELIAIPHQRVDRIEIGPGCNAEHEAILHAFTTDPVIHYVTGHGVTVGVAASPNHDHGGLHLCQRIDGHEPRRSRYSGHRGPVGRPVRCARCCQLQPRPGGRSASCWSSRWSPWSSLYAAASGERLPGRRKGERIRILSKTPAGKTTLF
jgi:CRISPR-associated protein Cas1